MTQICVYPLTLRYLRAILLLRQPPLSYNYWKPTL
jgi:hypothetical protein